MKNILLVAFLLLGTVNADFIRDNSLNVVSDTTACLMWQDDDNNETIKQTWENAIDYCESLDLAGFTDWRLPNVHEIFSIGERSTTNQALKIAFQNISIDEYGQIVYWSSTTLKESNDRAWEIEFARDLTFTLPKSLTSFVRCVRNIN